MLFCTRSLGTGLLLAVAACSAPPPPAVDYPAGDYGSWIERPHADWPYIAMINEIRYTDVDHPSAACGFLLDTGDAIVAVTAKHVLRYFKSDAMDSVSFRGTLSSWRMFPKNAPSHVTVLGELINEDESEPLERIDSAEDWLLLTVRKRAEGVQPLRFRQTPMEKGETVYVVGWRYPDTGPQRILEGKYVRSERSSLLISVPELTGNTIPGLSGSPVIDAHGYLIGLMSTKAGELQRLSGIEYPLSVLAEMPS